MNQVDPKFVNFLKMLVKEGGISTRELSKSLGKSTSYVSRIITGRIKTISFENAFVLLKEINKRYKFASSSEAILDMLEKVFGMHDEKWFEKQEQIKQEEEEKRRELLEKINSCLLVNFDNLHIEHILHFCQMQEYDHILFEMIFSLLKENREMFKLFVYALYYAGKEEWGGLMLSEEEKKLITEIQKIIQKGEKSNEKEEK